MTKPTRSRSGRLGQRLRLSQVQDRSDARLRDRWQRRLDAGEAVLCRRCRLLGVTTRIDPEHWHLDEDTRVPGCQACHVRDRRVQRSTA